MRKLLSLVEGILERFWALVLSLLCGVTGRSNFFFTRLFIRVAGWLLSLLFLLVAIVDATEGNSPFVFLDLVATALDLVAVRWVEGVTTRLEQGQESGEASLNILEEEFKVLLTMRRTSLLLAIVALVFGNLVAVGVFVLANGAAHFVTDFRPKRTSKVWQAIKALAGKLKDLAPEPSGRAPSPA